MDKKLKLTTKGPETLWDALPNNTKSEKYFPKKMFAQLNVKNFVRYDPELTLKKRTESEFHRIKNGLRSEDKIQDLRISTQSVTDLKNSPMANQNNSFTSHSMLRSTICTSPLEFRYKGYNSKEGFFLSGYKDKKKQEEEPFMLRRSDTYSKFLDKYKRMEAKTDREYDPKKDIWANEEEQEGNIKEKMAPTTWAEKNKLYENNKLIYRNTVIENTKIDKVATKIAIPDTPFAYNLSKGKINIFKDGLQKNFKSNVDEKQLPIYELLNQNNNIKHTSLDPKNISSPSSLLKSKPIGQLRRGFTPANPQTDGHGFFDGTVKSNFTTSALYTAKLPEPQQKANDSSPFLRQKEEPKKEASKKEEKKIPILKQQSTIQSIFSRNLTKEVSKDIETKEIDTVTNTDDNQITGISFFKNLFAGVDKKVYTEEPPDSPIKKVFKSAICQLLTNISPGYYKRFRPITTKSVILQRKQINLDDQTKKFNPSNVEIISAKKHKQEQKEFSNEKQIETVSRKDQIELNKKRILIDKKTRMIPFNERKEFVPYQNSKGKQFSGHVVNRMEYKDMPQPKKFFQTKNVYIGKNSDGFNPLIY